MAASRRGLRPQRSKDAFVDEDNVTAAPPGTLLYLLAYVLVSGVGFGEGMLLR